MAQDCIFCRIGAKEVPTQLVYEDDDVVGFDDLNPQAPVHVLLIPKRHITGLTSASEDDLAVLGRLQLAAKAIAEQKGVTEGCRLVTNCGPGAGQSVLHLHYHLLGGRRLGWPPG